MYNKLLLSLSILVSVSCVGWAGCDSGRTSVTSELSSPASATGSGQEQKDYYLEMATYYEAEAEAMRQIAADCRAMHTNTSTSPISGESYEEYYEAYREELGELCQSYEELAAKYTQITQKYSELASSP